MEPLPSRPTLSDALCQRFAALAVLDRLAEEPAAYHAALLEGDNAFLEPVFDYLLAEDLVAVGEDDRFRMTPLGRRAYQRLVHQQQSYLAHFDIYAAVDLAEGEFGDPNTDYLDDLRWADLRVAVAEYKGIDPYRLVFISMLAGGQFFENPGWKFDLALGSSFFRELEEVVRSQIGVEELGYEDEDGTTVTGEDVLVDVILQGAALNQQNLAEERAHDPALLPAEDEEDIPAAGANPEGDALPTAGLEAALVPYDPGGPAAAYAASAKYVERLWLDSHW